MLEAPKILETLMCSISKDFWLTGKALMQASATMSEKNSPDKFNFEDKAELIANLT